MKSINFLVFLFFPVFGYSQEQGNPFEKANIIIVYHKMDIETAFDEMYNLRPLHN